MNKGFPMDDQLLRYAMNLMESAEVAQVEARLERDPEAVVQLEVVRHALEPLSADKPEPVPPVFLAANTIAKIRNEKSRSFSGVPKLAFQNHWGPHHLAITRFDLLVAASLMILAGGILFPLLGSMKNHAEIKQCAQNLNQFHQSFVHYSNLQPDGSFPKVEEKGPRSFAGVFVPSLRHHGLLTDSHSVACGNGNKRLPSETNLDQLHAMFQNQNDRRGYDRLAREAGGDYAYNIGYQVDGKVKHLTRESDQHIPLLADKTNGLSRKNSPNHGGNGQNVLHVGGHVRWLPARKSGITQDDIFLNDDGHVQAGRHLLDHVLGPSHSRPSGYQD